MSKKQMAKAEKTTVPVVTKKADVWQFGLTARKFNGMFKSNATPVADKVQETRELALSVASTAMAHYAINGDIRVIVWAAGQVKAFDKRWLVPFLKYATDLHGKHIIDRETLKYERRETDKSPISWVKAYGAFIDALKDIEARKRAGEHLDAKALAERMLKGSLTRIKKLSEQPEALIKLCELDRNAVLGFSRKLTEALEETAKA